MIEPSTDPAEIAAELDAMKELAQVLVPLTPGQRRRVLDWARQFGGPIYRGAEAER